MIKFEDLKGKIIVHIDVTEYDITFHLADGSHCMLTHRQECCEQVYIESIVGDLTDLIDQPILVAEKSHSDLPQPEGHAEDCYVWTFYKLDAIKGGVTIRFYGESNGYYSTDVDFKYYPPRN